MWNIRDAILAWLYERKIDGRTVYSIGEKAVSQSVGWSDEPISEDEITNYAPYLVQAGYVSHQREQANGVLIGPTITPAGEQLVALGKSVRPGQDVAANPAGITNTYNITNNAPAQMAIDSSGVVQSMPVQVAIEKVNSIADALNEYAARASVTGSELHGLVGELREVVGGLTETLGSREPGPAQAVE